MWEQGGGALSQAQGIVLMGPGFKDRTSRGAWLSRKKEASLVKRERSVVFGGPANDDVGFDAFFPLLNPLFLARGRGCSLSVIWPKDEARRFSADK